MTTRFVLKKLTASDLTLFEWQFRNLNAGNQKAINLNANVFVDELYPAIEEATRTSDGRLPLDLWLFGPGGAGAINLQRKVIKGGAYKNWRLNGEFIGNPIETPDRFNVLAPDDFAFFAFEGEIVPNSATVVFVANGVLADQNLYRECAAFGMAGRNTMMSLDEAAVSSLIAGAALPVDHPLTSFLLTEDIQDAAVGGAVATERILIRARAPNISAATLRKAREAAEENGIVGEQLVAIYFDRSKKAGTITEFEWVSKMNAVAPLDFQLTRPDASRERIDVKATSGPFEREFHVSLPELKEMVRAGGIYRIYRVFELSTDGASLRISDDMAPLANAILTSLRALPPSVVVDAVSISPIGVRFAAEIELTPAAPDEEAPA